MKTSALLIPALVLLLTDPLAAFHEQGSANCEACHVAHDSQDGRPGVVAAPGQPALLRAESPSDLCLSCHAQALGAVLGLDPLTPPPEKGSGNFVFLKEDNLNDSPEGAALVIPGDAAGHNVVAPGQGLFADARHVTAPGGTFPASELSCTSCHDPHGNGNFRLLHGVGAIQGGIASFARPAPEAEGIGLSSGQETRSHHTAYRRGMSEWCGNCHGRYHEGAAAAFEHPSDATLGAEASDQYNRYDGDDRPTQGHPATAYLPAVPFEDRASTVTSTLGSTNGSRVMCLTCHRAHATSAPAAGRWDFRLSLLREDGLASGSYPLPSPYDSPSQGPLCRKCHQDGGAQQPD